MGIVVIVLLIILAIVIAAIYTFFQAISLGVRCNRLEEELSRLRGKLDTADQSMRRIVAWMRAHEKRHEIESIVDKPIAAVEPKPLFEEVVEGQAKEMGDEFAEDHGGESEVAEDETVLAKAGEAETYALKPTGETEEGVEGTVVSRADMSEEDKAEKTEADRSGEDETVDEDDVEAAREEIGRIAAFGRMEQLDRQKDDEVARRPIEKATEEQVGGRVGRDDGVGIRKGRPDASKNWAMSKVVSSEAIKEKAKRGIEDLKVNFEERFGAHLYYWIGAIAVIMAGGLGAYYAIEQGYVTQELRVAFGAVLGLGLTVLGYFMTDKSRRMANACCG
ncbi:MAG: DUF2339 domain-containing protein, partial [Pseudomonadales bacterium]|nr:DUF2339 domain-containing protein [Pseudomonadales bacterium]